ncbi:MAG: hypothetical protein JWM89_1789 [Acidimicrobiales bacterium]|nr:hypothetical protein [Acidimicrobiales bacterium]
MWEPAPEGNEGTWWGYTCERHLVGQVAFYDLVAGVGPGWVGYRLGERVTGRCESAELAMRLVERRASWSAASRC